MPKYSFPKFTGKADRQPVRARLPGLGTCNVPKPPPGMVDQVIDIFLFRFKKTLDLDPYVKPHKPRRKYVPPPEPDWYYTDKKENFVLEAAIEGAVERWAKTNKIMTRKMNGQGNRSWPDRMYIFPDGKIAFIEFKAPRKKLTELQAIMLDKLHARHVDAEMFDDKRAAISWLAQWLPDGPLKPLQSAHTTRNFVSKFQRRKK